MAEIATTARAAESPRSNRPRGGRRDNVPTEVKEFEELVINIDRVARVVKGGRRFRFKALVVVGNGKGKVGVGVAKGTDVQQSIAKATDVAKKNIIQVATYKGTIPHDIQVRYSGAHVLIKPASAGTGIIAGGVVRSIIGVTGIKDMLTKSLGSTNKVNIAYATIEALRLLVPRSQWPNASVQPVRQEVIVPVASTDKPASEKPTAPIKKEVQPPKLANAKKPVESKKPNKKTRPAKLQEEVLMDKESK